ncbi:hypothetical protein B0J12DRAFT_705511 [Macrophomina phaseolina]|uniref:Chromo domain-containing protein n=1 Tax=Macrophomina phaseolina TaxID=35725 RepID=A0ABQ8FRZ1_9PEZI|nr:hypothetical protein B0J12DRAFT_705511 [Macrophomina phaseolina]
MTHGRPCTAAATATTATATLSHSLAKKQRRQKTRTKANTRTAIWHAARAILDEDAATRRYLIDWEDVDPDTGTLWKPTWEPRHNANTALVGEWAARKAGQSAVDARGGIYDCQNKMSNGDKVKAEGRLMREGRGGHTKAKWKPKIKNQDEDKQKPVAENKDPSGSQTLALVSVPAKVIVGERKRHYIAGRGQDTLTREPFDNTEGPKQNASCELADALKARKRRERQAPHSGLGEEKGEEKEKEKHNTITGDNRDFLVPSAYAAYTENMAGIAARNSIEKPSPFGNPMSRPLPNGKV